MKASYILAAASAALALAACAHGGSSSMPGTQSVAGAQAQKMALEQQRSPSSFVAPKHPGFMAEAPSNAQWPTGIANAGEAPVPGGMFAIENQYNAVENGHYVTVYAGAEKPSGQGVLLVVDRSPDLHTVTARTEIVASSSVRIESVDNGSMRLRESATGQAIVHSVPSF
jgi:hypothetical protein